MLQHEYMMQLVVLHLKNKTQAEQSPHNSSLETPDDDQWWSKHKVDNVAFKISLKDALYVS
jgi:hypothetical protein